MKRSVALISVVALFLIGVLVGALGAHLFRAERLGREGPGGRGGRHFVERLARQLDLTEDQLQQVEEIVRESRREVEALHREVLPRARAHIEKTEERIREVLTPDQQQRFEEMRRRHRSWAERFFLSRDLDRPGGLLQGQSTIRRRRPTEPFGTVAARRSSTKPCAFGTIR